MKDKVTTPWGEWEVLLSEKNYKVKRIKVFPGHRLSYQRHFKRDEHWVIVEGEGVVTLNGREIILKKALLDYHLAMLFQAIEVFCIIKDF